MFGELVVAYLFLGGAGAGGCAVASVLGLLVDAEDGRALRGGALASPRGLQFRRFFASILGVSLGCLALGVLCLALDLGRFDRLALIAFASPANLLVIGTWSLVLCAALTALSIAEWLGPRLGRPGRAKSSAGLVAWRILQVATFAAAMAAAGYTGLLLASMPSVPLWHSGWLPALFVLSSLSCGIALVVLASLVLDTAPPFRRTVALLVRTDRVVLLLEIAVLGAWLASVWVGAGGSGNVADPAHGTAAAAFESVLELIEGAYAVPFWCGLVGAGLALPLAAETVWLRLSRSVRGGQGAIALSGAAIASALAVLVGGFALRAVVVGAAMAPVVGVSF